MRWRGSGHGQVSMHFSGQLYCGASVLSYEWLIQQHTVSAKKGEKCNLVYSINRWISKFNTFFVSSNERVLMQFEHVWSLMLSGWQIHVCGQRHLGMLNQGNASSGRDPSICCAWNTTMREIGLWHRPCAVEEGLPSIWNNNPAYLPAGPFTDLHWGTTAVGSPAGATVLNR